MSAKAAYEEYIMSIYSDFTSLKSAFSVSIFRLAFDLNTTWYEPIKSKQKTVKGTLIATYSHQLWLIVKIA